MNLDKLNKDILKSLIKEVLQDEPELLRSLINEVLVDNDLLHAPESEIRTKRFEMKLDEDFDGIGDVFKAIA